MLPESLQMDKPLTIPFQSTGPNSIWSSSIGDSVIVAPHTTWISGDIADFDMSTVRGCGNVDGLLTQYVVVDDLGLVRAPKNLSFEEAAALPCAGATAINALGSIPIGKGTTVVAQGTGGVSCFIIQVTVHCISTERLTADVLCSSMLQPWGQRLLRRPQVMRNSKLQRSWAPLD